MAVRITGAGVALTVGIILLTALIIGGLFWARQNAEVARQNEATQIAQEQLEKESGQDVALNEGDKASEDEKKDEQQNSSNSGSSANQGAGAPSGTTSQPGSSQSTSELPQTGPKETLSAIAILALLGYSVAAYVGSRQRAL